MEFLGKTVSEEMNLRKKCLRNILWKLNTNYNVEHMEVLIWGVDEDSDGKVSKWELMKMFKRWIVEESRVEPKRFFYIINLWFMIKKIKKNLTEKNLLKFIYSGHVQNKYEKSICEMFSYEMRDY